MINAHVLVLNRNYQAVDVTSWRRAMCLLYIGAARALDKQYRLFDFEDWAALSANVDDQTVGTANRRIVIPRIVVLQVYDRIPVGRIRFSRHNLFARDNHTCQYCNKRLPRRDLNLDHIIPRSRGGKTNWENVVTSCIKCNFKKGGRTPEEANMKLIRPARQPRWGELVHSLRMRGCYREWLPFLNMVDASYWNTELETD
ncbi:MAG: HNH endonuclease [Deltaproteobacteria bacterium]|nr:HNH endonuclease [Deltaproteobacteria bacterium]